MRLTKTVLATLLAGALVGGGYLYAQPKDDGTGAPLPEVTATGETQANISPREMKDETARLRGEMEKMHQRVLELQASARKARDVIKLNCVNEKLLAVKQLLNIADAAENDLTEAISAGDRDAQVHQYSQVKLAHERATAERDDAEGCIGEEIIFVGKSEIRVQGPAIPDDPTDDGDDPFAQSQVEIERAAYASPFN